MSGIYIHMEMPDRCFSCPLCNIEPTGESSCATSFGPGIEYKEIAVETAIDTRSDWCPLIPVPDHGDLIDKSKVDVLSWTDGEYGTDFADGVLFVLDKLDELPVVIPAEGEDYVPAEEVDNGT